MESRQSKFIASKGDPARETKNKMNSSEIRAALSTRFANVKFSRKANVWTMTDPEKSTVLARRAVITMTPAIAEKEASEIVAFRAE